VQGTFPGPTIPATVNTTIAVQWVNDLRDASGALLTSHLLSVDTCVHGPDVWGSLPRIVSHVHGVAAAARFDGYPELWLLPGQSDTYIYESKQSGRTMWYHDHALGITRLNVYAGLAGFFLLRDPAEDSLGLPSGDADIPLAILDRTLDASTGALVYPAAWQHHFFGNTLLVNGKVMPYAAVRRAAHRLRLLNACQARFLTLRFVVVGTATTLPFTMIATEGGLRSAPLALTSITLGPAERAEVIVDFSLVAAGGEVEVLNSAPAPFTTAPDVQNGVVPRVMRFVVGLQDGSPPPALPAALRTIDTPDISAARVRDFVLVAPNGSSSCTTDGWTINGLHWDDVTELIPLGSTEVWRWINPTAVTHPMHAHAADQIILSRNYIVTVADGSFTAGAEAPIADAERGYKDTVAAPAGQITTVALTFSRWNSYPGLFAYHCHMLDHGERAAADRCDGSCELRTHC
jgi:spore coat protein A